MNYITPSILILVKFLFKLSIDKEVNSVDFYRALLLMPIDASFLCFSFASASLKNFKFSEHPSVTPILCMLIFFASLIMLLLVTILSRKSEKCFILTKDSSTEGVDKEQKKMFIYSGISIFITFITLLSSSVIGS